MTAIIKKQELVLIGYVTLILLPSFLMLCGEARHAATGLWSVAFVPGANEIVTAGAKGLSPDFPQYGELLFWSTRTGHIRQFVNSDWGLRSLACSADGKFIVTGDAVGETRMIDAKTGKVLAALAPHARLVNAVAISANNRLFASGGFDGKIKLWNGDGIEKGTIVYPDGEINNLAISPDARTLVATSRKGTAWKFDLSRQEKPKVVFAGLTNTYVEAVAFMPDGRRFVTGCETNLKIWDTKTCELVKDLKGSTTNICGATFSPNGRILAVVDEKGTLSLWNPETGECSKSVRAHPGFCYGVAISPDGRRIATVGLTDRKLKVWDIRKLTLIVTGNQ